ncbi:hydrogenase expression/synthesis HypA [Chloroherpeton thalassium ATCC 35110]|uniref:Hydrogenase maturation factor HypA n=2 Tax=Chloroherpeton thalassium TaxID=100716 RepID=B3QYI5_CHLT3|nr:hydrogenase expression/synthesis HypA [Chloroherpeton thalassium ATCC 35110]
MSIAMSIVEIVTAKANEEHAEKINMIEIEIGSLAGVQREALEFCMESACKGTLADSAAVTIHELAALARCEECGYEFQPDFFFSRCSECGGFRVKIVQGKELKIRSINID